MEIHEGSHEEMEHVFLKCNDKIYDMYWEPMKFHLLNGYDNCYKNSKSIDPKEYWEKTDIRYI